MGRVNPGDAQSEDKPELEDLLFSAITDVLQNQSPGCMPIKFVVMIEVIDPDGTRALWTAAGPDVRAWDTKGMLLHALTIQLGQTMAYTTYEIGDDDGNEDS
jgi:hypothetical protein